MHSTCHELLTLCSSQINAVMTADATIKAKGYLGATITSACNDSPFGSSSSRRKRANDNSVTVESEFTGSDTTGSDVDSAISNSPDSDVQFGAAATCKK